MKDSSLVSDSKFIDDKQPYLCQEYDKIIRFRSLNREHNFIFIKNKNSIVILDPIKLIQIYTFYHNESIIDFAVSSKNSSLILCTNACLEIHKLSCENLSDYYLKIEFELKKETKTENLQNLSVSTLGDVIATINKHKIIKLYDANLNLIKTLNFQVSFLSKETEVDPLDVFQITYDTRNILLCKYNSNKISLIYKSREGEDKKEYAEKIISYRENIIFLKEYQKNMKMYIDYQDSSIFFMLTTNLNFLILRKNYEIDPSTYDNIPNTIILLYIDLSSQTEIYNYPSISFSLIYDNENPIFKGEQLNLENLQSGIINMDSWNCRKNKNTLSENEGFSFLNYGEYNLKNISSDYILFNLYENIVIFKVSGLQSPPFNNPTIDKINNVLPDKNYNKGFVLIKATKTLDRKYSLFFVDEFLSIREFIVDEENIHLYNCNSEGLGIKIKDKEEIFPIYRNIKYSEYNTINKYTFIFEFFNNDSIIILLDDKLHFKKMIIFKGVEIIKIHWIKQSNFIIFSYSDSEDTMIGILFIFSKYLQGTYNYLTYDNMCDYFYITNIVHILINQKFKKLLDIFMNYSYMIYSSNVTNTNSLNLSKMDKSCDNLHNVKTKIGFDGLNSEFLIKTDTCIAYCELIITKNLNEEEENEYNCNIKLRHTFNVNDLEIESKIKLVNMDFMFYDNCIYFYEVDSKHGIFNINSFDFYEEKNTIFQTIIFKDLYFIKSYFNNYLIFISPYFINTYDLINREFYRIRNDFVKENSEYSIDLIQCGIFIFLILISNKKIILIRVPRNKNNNELFYFEFKNTFEINKQFNKLNIYGNYVILNDSQIEFLSKITELKHNLLFNSKINELILLNSNPNSLFDCETLLDLLLSENEEFIKIILNNFCELYNNYKDPNKIEYKNSKLIPNFLNNNSLEIFKKMIFENKTNDRQSNEDDSDSDDEDKTYYSIKLSELNKTRDKSKSHQFLKFKYEEDEQNSNPINLWCSKNSNLIHLKYTYDLISQESTRNYDQLTKYFILKIKSKYDDIQQNKFKMSSADVCWMSLINNQEDILKFICKGKISNITWDLMKMFNIPLWIKSDIKLKELLEYVGKNTYKLLLKEELKQTQDKTIEKNYTEKIALYYFLADKTNLIIDSIEREPHNEKIKKFIMRDFSIQKNQRAAKENADILLVKKKYIYAAYFYLLGDDIRSALDMTLEKMRDINLTICLLRLINGKYKNDSWKKYYSLDKIYQYYFINFGTIIQDPWLITCGYLSQKKLDLALEFILNYRCEYNFNKNKELVENIDDYVDNLDLISSVFGIAVFDYKILLFAKCLEKLYNSKYEEINNQVKNVENTNFEDLWDMDGDNDNTNSNTNINAQIENNENELKKINIDYKNISNLCLINSLKRGVIFSPIIYLYKSNNNNNFSNLQIPMKKVFKHLISNRVILDTAYLPNISLLDIYYKKIDKLFEYIENNGIINKIDLYSQVNDGLLLLDKFDSLHISCIQSGQLRKNLIGITNYIEKLINRNIYILINFNFYENVNLNKIKKKLNKLNFIVSFIEKIINIIKTNEKIFDTNFSNIQISNAKLKQLNNNFECDIKEFLKDEIYLYIYRIIFMTFIYQMLVSKLILEYNHLYETFLVLRAIASDYDKLSDFCNSKLLYYTPKILDLSKKIMEKIDFIITNEDKNKPSQVIRDPSTSFFIQFLNLAFIREIKSFIENNSYLCTAKFKVNIDLINDKMDPVNYFSKDFKFLSMLLPLVISFTNNFEAHYERYVKSYMDLQLTYEMHFELKKIYILENNYESETNYYKFSKIKIQQVFKNEEELSRYETNLHLQDIISEFLSYLCKKFQYEKKNSSNQSNNEEEDENNRSTYSKSSIDIIKNIFRNGYEISHFKDNMIIQDFAFNSCDMSNMVVSFDSPGHRKINILESLLNKKRTSSKLTLLSNDTDNWEEEYFKSSNNNYNKIIEEQLTTNYSELFSIINHEILKQKMKNYQFLMTCTLPPTIYNEIPYESYLSDISLNDMNIYSQCRIFASHPQLPIYLTSNSNGVIGIWSYKCSSKKSLDEYIIDKSNSKDKNYLISRLKFNSYGNEFLATEQEGNLYLWSIEHVKMQKTPKFSILKKDNSYIKDAAFLNNSGVLVSTNNKQGGNKSILWDMLLPTRQMNVGQVNIGGSFVLPLPSDASFIVINDMKGMVNFVDIRKMESINSFQAHNEEIKSVKLSSKENILVTFAKDSVVKIWDLSNKSDPKLIEEITPFNVGKDEKKNRYCLKICDGFLFAAKGNVIKLLRNKII